MKRVILTVLTAAWMGLIFALSSDNADQSKKKSDTIIDKTVYKVCQVVSNDCNKSSFRKKYNFIIRKLAHFSEYFILGVLVIFTLREYGVKNVFIPIIFCVLYASSDEIHQLFIKGRTGSIIDVLIDSCGSLTSILLLYYFYFT